MIPTLRSAFVVDGLGAALSALFLGGVLPRLQDWIGLPTELLYLLAGIAALFALNAALGYRFGGERQAAWLRGITFANLAYCALTAALVGIYFAELQALGVAYFLGEIGIILGLVAAEHAVLKRVASERGPNEESPNEESPNEESPASQG